MAPPSIRAEDLSFVRDGDLIKGFAAWPSRTERLPAVIVVPDVHGLSDHYREVARRFALEGFFAFVIDLYSREGRPKLTDLPAVQAWILALDDRRVLADLAGAARFLRSRMEVRSLSIGITGFCMGGQYALLAACSAPEFAACASFYGMLRYDAHSENKPASPLQLAPQLHCPYLGLFGSDDALIPAADVEELRAILTANRKNFALHVYPGAGHAFFNDSRPDAYRPQAAEDAWSRVVAFFRQHLMADRRPVAEAWR